ncbi:sensor histidine kinase [Desertibaculum subflavum]|uniref:sensor histidine kinase n=1 Tax=Desertibaculum subflavum TaxID=2268458 RepID=UPI0034D34F21
MPAPPLLKALLASAAPVALVLAVLVLSGELAAGPAIAAGLGMLVLLLGVFWALLRDLRRLTAAVNRMADDPSAAPSLAGGSPLGGELLDALQRLVRDLGGERRELVERAQALEAMLDRAPDPLLVVDLEGIVRAANAAALEVLENQPIGRNLAIVLRQPELLEAVDLLVAGLRAPSMVEFEIGGQVRRQFRAYLSRVEPAEPQGVAPPAPDAGGTGRPGGILIAMQELTELKRAERMRADFVANASHELRTPLATLVGFIETLQGPARDDTAARERFLAIMHEQGQRMTRLIRDLLSLSRIELNEHTRPDGRVNLRQVVDSVVKMVEPLAQAKKMAIVVESPPNGNAVMGDQDELTQVVQNLVDNAIKYGDAETPVTVRVQPEGKNITLAVGNEGEGIPREHLPRLTERFYRVDSARSRALGGTGLGLAIVKHIVNRHRGSLSIESAERRGAVFKIAIPAAPSEHHDRQPNAA